MSPFSTFTFATNPHWIRSDTSPPRRLDTSADSRTLALLPISFFLFLDLSLVTAVRTHGRPHPFHDLRLARRPRGQYVHLRSAHVAARCPADTTRVEKVLVILRDGRKLLGLFRSYDQFGELRLSFACDRSRLKSVPYPRRHSSRRSSDHTSGLRRLCAKADYAAANFLLESTVERLHYKLEYADRDLGGC